MSRFRASPIYAGKPSDENISVPLPLLQLIPILSSLSLFQWSGGDLQPMIGAHDRSTYCYLENIGGPHATHAFPIMRSGRKIGVHCNGEQAPGPKIAILPSSCSHRVTACLAASTQLHLHDFELNL